MASSSSTTSSRDSFGFHREEIRQLKRDWEKSNKAPRCKVGSDVLQCLLDRKEGFYFSNSFFDIPDHPVKILPYPASQPVPTFADALGDAMDIRSEELVDRVSLESGNITLEKIPGPEMVNRFIGYLEDRKKPNLNSVVYPLSMRIPRAAMYDTRCGIGKVDVNALVPPMFRERDRMYLPGPEGWKTALVPPHAFATTHFDHPICGQVMAHFFGRKIWLFCPPDPENMDVWYNIKVTMDYIPRMKLMIKTGKRLFVWVSEQPCIMVLPPHCFHTVFTLSTACHSGVRAGCDLWQVEMTEAIRRLCDEKEQEFLRLEKNVVLLDRSMVQIIPDIEIWIEWCETIQREPTDREAALIDLLDGLITVIKFNLTHYFRRTKKNKK